tara:strand:+ start:325 stop:804 length:480 start_codon:yes stop_codon:yes gene_type:complete
MKNIIIIIITLLSITTSALSQAPQGEFEMPLGKYFIWDGEASEQPVHALIGYQKDLKFPVQILCNVGDKQMLFSKTFTAVHKKAFDGEYGSVKLDFKNNYSGRSIQLLKISAPNKNGFNRIIHYFYMSEFQGIKDFRMIIKDQYIIDIIDIITRPDSKI